MMLVGPVAQLVEACPRIGYDVGSRYRPVHGVEMRRDGCSIGRVPERAILGGERWR